MHSHKQDPVISHIHFEETFSYQSSKLNSAVQTERQLLSYCLSAELSLEDIH